LSAIDLGYRKWNESIQSAFIATGDEKAEAESAARAE
jgi:hypothetical protein